MMLSAPTRWWQARAPRERAMLLVMAAALGAFAWWFGLWRPLDAWRDRAVRDGARSDRQLERLQSDAVAIAAMRTRAGTADPAARRKAILETLASAGFAPTRQRDEPGVGLQLELDAIPAPALLAWLETLRTEHGIGPASLHASRANGMLQAEVTFAAAAP